MKQRHRQGSEFSIASVIRLLMTTLLSASLLSKAVCVFVGVDSALAVVTEIAGAQASAVQEAEVETEVGNDEASGCADPATAQLDGLLLAAVTATAAEWPAHNASFARARLSSAVAAEEITDCCGLIGAGTLPLRQRSACPW